MPFLALMDLIGFGTVPVVFGLVPDEVPAVDVDGVVDEVDGGGAIPRSEAEGGPCWLRLVLLPSWPSVESETFPPFFISSEIWADFAGKTDFIDFSSVLGWMLPDFWSWWMPGLVRVPLVRFFGGFVSILHSVVDFLPSRVLAALPMFAWEVAGVGMLGLFRLCLNAKCIVTIIIIVSSRGSFAQPSYGI